MGLGFGFTKLMRETIDRNRSMLNNTIQSKNRLKYKGSNLKVKRPISNKKVSPNLLKSIREKTLKDNMKSKVTFAICMLGSAIIISYCFWAFLTSPIK
jgi:hypothetical protein